MRTTYERRKRVAHVQNASFERVEGRLTSVALTDEWPFEYFIGLLALRLGELDEMTGPISKEWSARKSQACIRLESKEKSKQKENTTFIVDGRKRVAAHGFSVIIII